MNKYVKLHSNNDPIEIHYTLINGVNDDMKELDRMCKLLDRYNITIKFIRFNPINELEISKNEQLWVKEISNRVPNIRPGSRCCAARSRTTSTWRSASSFLRVNLLSIFIIWKLKPKNKGKNLKLGKLNI